MPGGDGFRPCGGRGVGGIIHKGRHRPACLENDPVQLLHFHLEGLIDPLRFREAELLLLHQLVDVQAIALGGRNPSGGGMGLFQIAHLRQIRQLIADGGGADAASHLRGDGFGAHRLRGADIILNDDFQYLLFPICEIHANTSNDFSTRFP